MRILMLYANDLFDRDLEEKSIAGTQTAFIELSRAFEQLGVVVNVYTDTLRVLEGSGRTWNQLSQVDGTVQYDLMIVNVSPYLFESFKYIKAKRKILWIHNEAKYLLYWHRLKFLLKYRPVVVFSGKYHKSTLPFFIPTGGRKVIPFGISDEVLKMGSCISVESHKKVYFTSNPLRSLRWLVDLWVAEIHPKKPEAELHVFAGWKTYGAWGKSVKNRMQTEIEYASRFAENKIIIRDVIPKHELFKEMKQGRAMFYRGDRAETFCLAVAEAQALGLPAVVCDLGSMKERVQDGVTGFVSKNDAQFIKSALSLLTDDKLHQLMSSNSINYYADINWRRSANLFISSCT
jgi:glycosyltransferase involved in cell wall biosynthesis